MNWAKLVLTILGSTLCYYSSADCVVKSLGMGYVGTAYPQEATSGNYNPANIAFLCDRWDASGGAFFNSGTTKIKNSINPDQNGNRTNSQAKWVPIGSFGINKWITDQLVVNFSTDGIRSFKGTYRKGFPPFGHGHFGKEFFIPLSVPGIAWKFNCRHAIGISFPIYTPRIKVNGVQNISAFSIHPHHVSNKGYCWAFGLGVRFGYYFQATDCLSFGAMVKPKLLAASHFKKYAGLFPSRGLFEDPLEIRAGVHYRWNCWNFALDYDINFFSQAKTLSNSAHSTALSGTKNGPSLGWKNQQGLKMGFDYRLNECLTLRSGFEYYFPTLIRKGNVETNLGAELFLLKYAVDVGATYIWNGFEFSFAYGQVLPNSLRSRKSVVFEGGSAKLSHWRALMLLGIGTQF